MPNRTTYHTTLISLFPWHKHRCDFYAHAQTDETPKCTGFLAWIKLILIVNGSCSRYFWHFIVQFVLVLSRSVVAWGAVAVFPIRCRRYPQASWTAHAKYPFARIQIWSWISLRSTRSDLGVGKKSTSSVFYRPPNHVKRFVVSNPIHANWYFARGVKMNKRSTWLHNTYVRIGIVSSKIPISIPARNWVGDTLK